MPQFRKRPVVIDAIPALDAIRAAREEWSALPDWLVVAYDLGGVVFTDKSVSLPTLEGTMTAGVDDWIIRGVKGELYPCKSDIFAATYEAVDEPLPDGDPRPLHAGGGCSGCYKYHPALDSDGRTACNCACHRRSP